MRQLLEHEDGLQKDTHRIQHHMWSTTGMNKYHAHTANPQPGSFGTTHFSTSALAVSMGFLLALFEGPFFCRRPPPPPPPGGAGGFPSWGGRGPPPGTTPTQPP